MLSLRFAVVSVALVSAVACSDSNSPSPTSPTPTPTAPPAAPTAPPVAPTAPPVATSASIVIPVGAEFLGNGAFAPPELNIQEGTTVTWMNTDRDSHTTTSDASVWNSGTISPGRQFSFTFQTTGTFPYHCSFHPGMIGRIVVAARSTEAGQ